MPSKKRTFFSILILIVLITTFHYVGFLSSVENFLREIIIPGSKSMYEISIKLNDNEEKFSSVDDLRLAYQSAMESVLKNQIDISKKEILEKENEELRKMLNFAKKKSIKMIGAEVIGKNIDPLGNTLIINVGLQGGIREGDPVIVSEGFLVGKIARVEDKISIIRLISDSQSRVGATILNQDKSLGLVEGGYGVSVQMNYIPQNEIINIGDIVVTSGLEDNLPTGLLIGTIEAVEKEAYQPFQKAIVKPAINLEKIRLVSVMLN